MEKVGRFYSNLWKGYSFKEIDEKKFLPFYIAEELKAFREGVSLDIGCGTGRRTQAMIELGAKKIDCVDIDDEILLIARNYFNFKNTLNGVKLHKASAINLPFEDNRYNYVLCNGVLNLTKEWQKGISEIARVLKPGGICRIGLYHPTKYSWILNIKRFFSKNAKSKNEFKSIHDWKSHIDILNTPIRLEFREDKIRKVMNNFGLKEIKIMGHRDDYKHYFFRKK